MYSLINIQYFMCIKIDGNREDFYISLLVVLYVQLTKFITTLNYGKFN